MHGRICNDDKGCPKHCQSNHIRPQGQVVESESTENARSRNLNVKSISVVFKTQLGNLIDNQCFVAVVEDR